LKIERVDRLAVVLPFRSRPRLLALGLLTALALAGCATGPGGAGSTAAATVDGREISQAELDRAIPLFEFLSSLSQAPCGQPVAGESQRAACARFALGNLIQEEILQEYAIAQDVTVPQDEVRTTIRQVEEQLGGPGELDALLKDNGVTREELEAFAGRLLLFQQIQRRVGESEVTDDQLRQSYEQNQLQFTKLHTWHILVKSRAEAERLGREATPANFRDLADRYSIDPSVKQNHGDLDTVDASGLSEPFVRAALALRPGEISEPVQTEFGWHIIRLISSNVTPFEDVRGELAAQSSSEAFQAWFQNRLESADITVNPRYGRFDPATGLVSPVRSTATGSAEPPASPAGGTGATGSQEQATPSP
jgi:parvulin-like peptidyl-prolyl isomerase